MGYGRCVDAPSTVLLVHNYCQQQNLSGENVCYEAEGKLLERHGHRVVRYERHSDDIDVAGIRDRLSVASEVIWSRRTLHELRELIGKTRPDVVHVHNWFPLVSPSVYQACHELGVPVVQTLHNFRLICPSALLFREGRVCRDCVGKPLPLPGVVHGCYRGSRSASAAVAAMLATHRLRATWTRQVTLFVTPSEFARRQMIDGGLPADRIVVKPNFVEPDLGPGRHDGGYALFVGLLGPGKGVGTLLDAWERAGQRLPLRVVGDGPLAPLVASAADRNPAVRFLGRKPLDDVYALMGEATVLIFPSDGYETFGRVVAEAFARGTPVVAARHGPAADLVEDGRTGLHFRPGDANDLARTVEAIVDDPGRLRAMSELARRAYLERYTAARNYELMLEVYASAIERARRR